MKIEHSILGLLSLKDFSLSDTSHDLHLSEEKNTNWLGRSDFHKKKCLICNPGAQLARVHLHPRFFGNSLLGTKKMEVLHK